MITTIQNNSLVDFEKEFFIILESYSDEIEKAKKIICFIEETLIKLANWLKKHVFDSIEAEIIFFKEIKPNIVSKLIFYKEILLLIATQPLDRNKKAKHYEKKLNSIKQFHRKNHEFIKYTKTKSTYFDELYFTRKKHKDLFFNDCTVINYDSNFCTSHDYLLAEVIALEELSKYIENQINDEKQSTAITVNNLNSKLTWTAKKIDLIELIYALHESKAINKGQSDIKEITKVFEQALNVDLGDNITRSYIDIKNRKSDQTRFLNNLQIALENKIENDLI